MIILKVLALGIAISLISIGIVFLAGEIGRKMGIDDDLEKLGAKEGDIVKILDFSFEYRK